MAALVFLAAGLSRLWRERECHHMTPCPPHHWLIRPDEDVPDDEPAETCVHGVTFDEDCEDCEETE